MIDISYEKQGSYLQGKREGASVTKLEIAKAMLAASEQISKICAYTDMSEKDVLALKDS